MSRPGCSPLARTLTIALAAAGLALCCTGCLCHLAVPASTCVQTNVAGPLPGSTPHLCLVSPVTPRSPTALIVYATGDGGWEGTSKALFRHLAERGYPVVGISSPDYLKHVERDTEFITPDRLARDLVSIIDAAKRELKLPDATPVILVGISRGAEFMVVAAPQQALVPRPAGVVAVSLTRESNLVRNRRTSKEQAAIPGASTMESGQVLTYVRLKSAFDIPIAVIQSTHDRYLPAAEAHGLFGPDIATRRFVEVEARNHGFGGARDTVLRELDNALGWIESIMPPRGTSAASPDPSPP